MKRVLFLLLCLPLGLFAQSTEGTVYYSETLQLQIDVEGMDESMKKMIPSSQSNTEVLYFNAEESVYKSPEGEGEEDFESTSESGGNVIKMVIARPDNQFYKNLTTGTKIDKREFFSRNFLIEDQINEYQWKFTGKQKKVLDYLCQQATTQRDTVSIEAWFTMQIPVSNGPANYGGLPGLILEMDIDKGQRTIVAKKVQLEPLEKGTISAPTKGKNLTQEEFDKIVDEKMKEMNAEGGGGAVIKIRRN